MHPAGLYNVYNYKNQRKYIGHISSFNAAEQNIEHLYSNALRRIFSKDLSLDITMNILDDAAMESGSAVKFTRSYLQTLSTDALFALADRYGLFLSSDLTRYLLISELLDLDDGFANDDDSVDPVLASTRPQEAAYGYNMTEIRVVLKNPLWFFVFWDFHKRLFTELTEAKDFSFFSLRVHSLDLENPLKSSDFFDIQVPKEDRRRYVHVSFDEYLHRIDLMAHFTNGREQILSQSNVVGMRRKNIPQRLCISQNAVNKIIGLSGLTSLKKSHFRHYRQAFR